MDKKEMIIVTRETGDDKIVLDVDVPVEAYKIGGVIINGHNIWPNDLAVLAINLRIEGGISCPKLTLECFPKKRRLAHDLSIKFEKSFF